MKLILTISIQTGKVLFLLYIFFNSFSCSSNQTTNTNTFVGRNITVESKDGLYLRDDIFKTQKQIELLPNNTKLEWIGDSGLLELKSDRIGKWLKVKTPTNKEGWVFSSFIKFDQPDLNLNPSENPCEIKLKNTCNIGQSGKKIFSNPNTFSHFRNGGATIFNEELTIDEISKDQKWVLGEVQKSSYRKGWIQAENLVKNSQLIYNSNYEGANEKQEIWRGERKPNHIYLVTFGETNLLNEYDSEEKSKVYLKYGTKFYSVGTLSTNKNIHYGFTFLPKSYGARTYFGFLSSDVLISNQKYINQILNQFPTLDSLLQKSYKSVKRKGSGDDGCSWEYEEEFHFYKEKFSLTMGGSYETYNYNIVMIKEISPNKEYKFITTNEFGDSKFFEIKLKILSNQKISINGQEFIIGSAENHLNTKCDNNQ